MSMSFRSCDPAIQSPPSISRVALESPAAESTKPEGVADAALTFEYLALGKDRTRGVIVTHSSSQEGSTLPTTSNILSQPMKEPISVELQAMLLSRKTLDYVLMFAKDVITWQHACIHTPTFQRECEAFLSMEKSERWIWTDPLWLALFYVVQSIAIHQMPPTDVEEMFGSRKTPAEDFLKASKDCLDLGRYLSEPSFYTCQALAILCVCGHNVTDSNLLSSYLAIGIKTAQTLNLHNLGGESARVERKVSESGGEIRDNTLAWRIKIIDLEMGKRVWWSFVQQDYFAIPFRGTNQINPKHHDTPFPKNVHDEDLDKGELKGQYSDNELTLVNKLRLTAMAAQIVFRFFENLPDHGCRVEEHVAPFEAQLLQLLPVTQPKSSNPSLKFGLALRRYINISVSHKILTLHRAFCSRQPINAHQLHQSQVRCVEMARQILDQVRSINRSSRPEGQVGAIWTISYQAVAAATVIALNLFQGSSNNTSFQEVTREEVMGAKEILQGLSSRSTIAERGVKMMSELITSYDQADRNGSRSALSRRRSTTQGDGDEEEDDDDDSRINQKRPKTEVRSANDTLGEDHGSFDFDWDQYPAIAGVLESMPDVSKLFDGSIGNPFG
ncbi:hypothetical protein CBS101457_003568 [Exobasidium rhododendri]|nr:hypothetical protein CBS101457_003568 [Exobasidium rhododendri]